MRPLQAEDLQRWFVECRELLAQIENVLFPVAWFVEPGERPRERRVVPAFREPGVVVQQPERTQRLDQVQFAQIELVEFVIALDDRSRSPDKSIHTSCTAGAMRASSKSTKCGVSSRHRMLPLWQSPCTRIGRTPPASSKRVSIFRIRSAISES